MSPGVVRGMRTCLWFIIVLLVWLVLLPQVMAQIPPDAARYKRDLIRNARVIWGLDAPISTFAAQIHQESGWHADAQSPVGAQGLAQFMPATAQWLTGLYEDLAPDFDPGSPAWAIRALVRYDKWLYDAVPAADSHCERMAFVLSSYNGGLGWLKKDVALAKAKGDVPSAWFDHVEKYNGGRSDAAFRENRGYPARILNDLEHRYIRDGWGIKSC